MESKGFDHCHFTAIEIDEVIIDLLTRYGLDKISSPIEVFETDAIHFINVTREQYDIIAIDLFINDIIPDEVQSIDFLTEVKGRLSEKGIVMMNHLSLTEKDKDKGQVFFDNVFKEVFPNGTYIDVGGNWMLINNGSFVESK